MQHPDIAEILIRLKHADLQLREQLIRKGALSDGYNDEMKQLHDANAAKLDSIIDSIGYPTPDKVGKEGGDAAWLIIQHAIGQPAFMKKCLKLLEKAVGENKADPIHLAYLSDRIAVFEEKPQLYGTQFDWDAEGELSPNPTDDPDKVNRRRKALGLNSLEEQTAILRTRAQEENQSPPADHAKRQEAVNAWKKQVGWTQ